MKYCLSLLLALLTLPLWAQFPTNGLEAYYSFDDCQLIDTTSTVIPQSGNIVITNSGDIDCDPTGCSINGEGSLLFDGNDDQLIFINSLTNVFSTADFSMSFYIKPAFSAGIVNLFSKREDCSEFHAFAIDYNPVSNVLLVTLSEDVGLNGNVKAPLDFNRCWQHVVLVRDNRTTRLYINGVLKDEKTASKRIELTNSIGLVTSSVVCENRYSGNLDELFIYRTVLKQKDIDQLFYNPDQIANQDTTIFLGDTVQIDLTRTCADDFQWIPNNGVNDATLGEPKLFPTESTTYFVDMAGDECQANDSIRITIVDPDQLDCSVIFLPKAFTPNGDGLNDFFQISNPNAIDNLLSFEIFDRWGSKVFSTNNSFEGWDGNFKDEKMNPGVLLYRVRHICNGQELLDVGSFSIIR